MIQTQTSQKSGQILDLTHQEGRLPIKLDI